MNMRKTLVFLAALAFLAAVVALADTSQKVAGTVDDLAGEAQAKNGDGPERKLAKGAQVFVRDVISTPGPKDKARIAFADGSTLDVGPESMVAVKDFAFDEADKTKSTEQITMGKGVFRFVTGKVVAQNPDNLKVESPLSVIGIRGTTTDHWIQTKQKNVGGKSVTEVEAELHALRATKTGTEVVVKSETETLVLKKPGDVAWVRPKLPGSVRPLTDEEKQEFGSSSFKREEFDPAPPRRGIPGGGG